MNISELIKELQAAMELTGPATEVVYLDHSSPVADDCKQEIVTGVSCCAGKIEIF